MDTFVARHLDGVSRTYAILVPMLPRPLDEVVGLAYLVMRILDTLEDAPQLSDDERIRLLDELDAALADQPEAAQRLKLDIGESDAERALLHDASEVVARVQALDPTFRDAIRTCAAGMSGGVRKLVARSRARQQPYPAVRDAAEMREYCYYVAGVVGEMLCAMMAHHLQRPSLLTLRDLAVELGIGLQLVNILKDALKDSRQNRRYLPASQQGVSHAEIYKAVLNEARHSLRCGVEFVMALPQHARELRSFCGLPIAWGALTLARAEREPKHAKVERSTIHSSMERFGQLVVDDQALRRWLIEMLEMPETTNATSPRTV